VELPSVAVSAVEDAEEVAEDLRKRWDIGDWPIKSLSAPIGKSGVVVVTVDADEDIDGLSGIANRDIRFDVVASTVPVDRMRMNLAHELGHIVIKPTDDE
jgi:Zn-dependent peptidase ImmA (M78 family)